MPIGSDKNDVPPRKEHQSWREVTTAIAHVPPKSYAYIIVCIDENRVNGLNDLNDTEFYEFRKSRS